jgi:hypothetical protein
VAAHSARKLSVPVGLRAICGYRYLSLTANSPYHLPFEPAAGDPALSEPLDLGSVRMAGRPEVVRSRHQGIRNGNVGKAPVNPERRWEAVNGWIEGRLSLLMRTKKLICEKSAEKPFAAEMRHSPETNGQMPAYQA